MMKRILVTGGAGFIGSHLCERLLGEGNEVICLDNYFTGSKSNIVHLLKRPYFELVRHDVIMPYYIEVDEIYNLACPASPLHYQFNPIKTIKTSVMGAINMLGLAKRVKGRILQASTSEVYGDPQIHPQHEDYWGNVNPIGRRANYDEGKRCAETLFMDYHFQNKVDIKIARIFNTYGPRIHPGDGRVMSNFIVQALTNKDITINGDGNQSRSFQYINDLIEGLIRLMNTSRDITGPINLGNTEEITILQLAEAIIRHTKSRSNIIFRQKLEDDPIRRKPDITLARKYLNNWQPRISLDEGLDLTIAYFRDLLKL
jgi:UDP-glucuronate decarboxylase